MTHDKSPLDVLEELIDRQAPLGDDWSRSDLVTMAELFSYWVRIFLTEVSYYAKRKIFEPRFSNALTEGSFDSNVIIQIMEQLAQSSNPQQLRRLQTVMAASINDFVAIYNDVKLEPGYSSRNFA